MAVIFSRTFDADAAGFEGYSLRVRTDSLSEGGDQARARFVAASTATGISMRADHCSIGVLGTATFPSMAATDRAGRTQPIELKFSGASGFSQAPGASITSDFAEISFYSSDNLVIVMDFSSSSVGTTAVRVQSTGTPVGQFSSFGPTWNVASVSSFSAGTTFQAVNQIENSYYQPTIELTMPSQLVKTDVAGY